MLVFRHHQQYMAMFMWIPLW